MLNQSCIIILPCYNVGAYLAECLCSIKNQTYTNWKAIIVNDGSTDDTARVAQAFVDADSRFTLLSHTTNQGQAAARNTALAFIFDQTENYKTFVSEPENTWISFLDSDDYLDKDFLSEMLTMPALVKGHNASDYDIIQSGYRRVLNDGTVLEAKHPHHFYQFVSPCMRLYKSDLLYDLRFPERMIYEDVIFSLDLWSKHPKYCIIPYIGYNYRRNPTSTTSKPNIPAQHTLYPSIYMTTAPLWLKLYTIIRLKFHFFK